MSYPVHLRESDLEIVKLEEERGDVLTRIEPLIERLNAVAHSVMSTFTPSQKEEKNVLRLSLQTRLSGMVTQLSTTTDLAVLAAIRSHISEVESLMDSLEHASPVHSRSPSPPMMVCWKDYGRSLRLGELGAL